ncbi:MAG: type I-U CRISPR-associated protein Cas8c [Candidatus Omnitrophica bacterium]|nr:type I-U CRISPR-associated protein Cas8c [Candidatus Omnitrophota bacterium]
MSNPQPNIRINVDVTNPGQFFACCGLLELADRLWPGAEGWFEKHHFCIKSEFSTEQNLKHILHEIQNLTFDIGKDTNSKKKEQDKDDESLINPILLKWKNGSEAMQLDWWNDRSIKTWAGSMNHEQILRAMLDGIDSSHNDPFNHLLVVYDTPKHTERKKTRTTNSKKREPFYFDSRRGNKSHPQDSGFSPDRHKMESQCCPVVEALCFIGLQRTRPFPTGINNMSRYTVWSIPLTTNVLSPVVCGILNLPHSKSYIFKNYFRSDQRKHKAYSQAKLERNHNEKDYNR